MLLYRVYQQAALAYTAGLLSGHNAKLGLMLKLLLLGGQAQDSISTQIDRERSYISSLGQSARLRREETVGIKRRQKSCQQLSQSCGDI